jgi:DNA-binding IclR family transcriptional regulator
MLQARVKETVQVLMPRGADVVYVYGVEPDEPLRVTARSGDRMPAYVAAGGKALLAELPDGEVERLYADGLPEWPTRHRTSLPELKRELAQVRAQGYGTNLEETEPGVCALGCAVHAPSGRGVAALTIAVPSVRFDGVDTTAYAAALADARTMAEDLLPPDW